MKLIVLGNDDSFNELACKKNDAEWVRVNNRAEFEQHKDAHAFFNLNEDASKLNYGHLPSPVFINSVIQTTGNKKNVIRINGWSGFMANDTWEIAGEHDAKAEAVLHFLHKKTILTADVPGFISAGIIAMIINEAYFALEENVSTREEIDIAMKLGTNYPYGPFEWAKKIGLKNIYNLLEKLSEQNKKYSPAPLMTNLVKGQ
jgi:3-hydroxybutyryl-CoA dehydrogenase